MIIIVRSAKLSPACTTITAQLSHHHHSLGRSSANPKSRYETQIHPTTHTQFFKTFGNQILVERSIIEKIFHYNCDDENKTILTYRVYLKEHEKIDLKSFFPTTIIVHKKGECFYTINALNLLIESLSDIASGNINYKDYKIDWDNYQNKIILSNRGNLKIMGIQRDFSE